MKTSLKWPSSGSLGLYLSLICASLGLAPLACCAASASDPVQVSFRRDVAPILLQHCQECHGPNKSKGKFRLDTFERLMKGSGGDRPSITPRRIDQSELFRLISTTDEDDRMPQKADPLPKARIEIIGKWIEQGARFDGPDPAAPLASIVPHDREPGPPEVYQRPVPITALAFSPDGSELAASGYHEITFWDPANGKLTGRIKNLPERTWGLAYSPDGKFLAAAAGTPGTMGELRLCDAAGRTAGKVLERIADMMLVVRFSPDGTRLAAGGADNAIRIYNVESGRREQLIEQHADWVTDLAFSPDGLRLVSASRDKSARVFDVATGSMEAAYLGHAEGLLSVVWSQDPKQIYSAGQDHVIHCWNVTDAKLVGKISGFDGDVYKLDLSMDRLLCCASDGSVREYSPKKRELLRTLSASGEWVYSLTADPKARRVAVGGYSGEIQIWNVDTGELLDRFVAAPGYVPAK